MRHKKRRHKRNAWFGETKRHAAAARKGWKVRKRRYGKAGKRRRSFAHSGRGFRKAGVGSLFAA